MIMSRSRRVPDAVRAEIAAAGHAEVVCVLNRPAGAGVRAPAERIARSFLRATPAGSCGPAVRNFPRLGVMIGFTDAPGAAALVADPAVALMAPAAAPSLIRPVRRAPAAAATSAEPAWGIAALDAPRLWATGVTGAGVRIGHLDTGVDADHAALRGRVTAWAEFDANGNRVTGSRPRDPDGHGTHTAGTLCGTAGRGRTGGAIGMAPGAELCSAMVIEGGRVLLRIIAGMEWVISEGARVLSMSLGIRGYTPFAVELMARLRQAGVLPVIAIGNEGPGTSRSPGNYPEALSVGAADRRGRVADFSSSMRFERAVEPTAPDVVAPGVEIVSARAGGGREVMDGTSMATPHVAGLAALLFSARPAATVADVEAAIFASARPLAGEADAIRYGRGLVNGPAALAALRGAPLAPPARTKAMRAGTGVAALPAGTRARSRTGATARRSGAGRN
jgi:subtilisin family serine protease